MVTLEFDVFHDDDDDDDPRAWCPSPGKKTGVTKMLAGTDRFSLVTLRDSTDSRRKKKQEEEEGVMQL